MKYLLIKNFFRSKAHVIGLFLLLISGLISLEIGSRFLEKVEQVSIKTALYQQESIQRNVSYFNKEMGSLMYYLKFGLENKVPNLAGLSIGQRDIFPTIQSVSIRNLEEQRFSTDITNPLYQLLGNMDFSFVLIYFFPLVIISFGFNLISEEKEGGTWSLVRSQAVSPMTFLRYKMGIRVISVLAVLIVLLAAGKFYLHIPMNLPFLSFIVISVCYVLFWFGLTWLVISFQKNSSTNAQTLLICWVILNLILPAGINIIQRWLYPIPEAMTTVIQNREGYHSQWDKPLKPTLEKFYARYPQYSSFSHPKESDFTWLWYFAMQQQGDEESSTDVRELKNKLGQRLELSKVVSWIIPTVHTQIALNSIGLSDQGNYLNYLSALEDFHEELKLYFFPRIFQDSAVLEEDWSKFTLREFQDDYSISWFRMIAPFAIVIVGLLLWGASNFRMAKLY
jgi:ABC-2 type transport system permease protein